MNKNTNNMNMFIKHNNIVYIFKQAHIEYGRTYKYRLALSKLWSRRGRVKGTYYVLPI